MVCVGPNGTTQGQYVYVVTNSGNQFGATYTFFRSTDGGANFLLSSQNFANYVGTNVGTRKFCSEYENKTISSDLIR